MSGIRRTFKTSKTTFNNTSENKREELVGEDENQDGCLKYYYKNKEEFKTKNLPCSDRKWQHNPDQTSLEAFNDIDEYAPKMMDKYVDKYFSNDRFDGDSKFEFQENYKTQTSEEICDRSDFDLQPQQKFAGKFISNESTFPGILVYHGLGSGKCLGFGTPVMKSDGTIIRVENIKVGDKLMGDDSTPRNVLSLGTGRDVMYEIIPDKGEPFTCNSEHVLCVKGVKGVKGKGKEEGGALNITVKEYLKLSDSTKSNLKIYRKEVDFVEKEVPDPHFSGFFIGNTLYNPGNKSGILSIYKFNSRKVRLGFLAGLIDSCGFYSKGNYEFIQDNGISQELLDDIIYIARSLGFSAYKNIKMTGYWTMRPKMKTVISGNIYEIPCRDKGKIAKQKENNEDVLVTTFKVIEKPIDHYYGFTLDGNHRFLLGDFTVSHNTCTSIIIGESMKAKTTQNKLERIKGRNPNRVFIVVPKAVKEQYYEEIIGRIKGGKIVSCPGSCVITESDNDEGKRQFYVGKFDTETDEYETGDLNVISRLEAKINKISRSGTSSETDTSVEMKDKLKLLNSQLKEKRDIFHSLVDTVYHIISHDSFLNSVMVKIKGTDRTVPTKFLLTEDIFHSNKSLLIIDEIQKLVREEGSKYNKLYNMLNIYARNRVTGEPAMKVVLLTATPVYDNPFEAALMINLLRPRIQFPLNRDLFNELFIKTNTIEDTNTYTKTIKNDILLKYMLSGYVSYFKGGNPQGYPFRRNYIKLHKMKNFQNKEYSQSLIAEIAKEKDKIEFDGTQEGLYPISIQKCNIAYRLPEGELKTSISSIKSFYRDLKSGKSTDKILDIASNYSQKFVDIIKLIDKSPGPVFIYTKWIGHGIVGLYTILDALGWKFLNDSFKLSDEKNRYAIWSPGGLATKGFKQESKIDNYLKNMRQIFNSPENKNGELCKVLISNVVEGISLKGVNQVHVCEPWWNMSKMEQIIARAIRLCSHEYLPKERQFVDVFYHASILKGYPNYDNNLQASLADIDPKMIYFKDMSRSTIEQKMYISADKKQHINVQFELALKQSAIDCNINKEGNIVRLEETILPSIVSDGVIDSDGSLPLYNRSNNKYYLLENKGDTFFLNGLDILHEVKVLKTYKRYSSNKVKEDSYKTVHNWPPIGIQRNNYSIKLEPWQVNIVAGNTSVTILEDTLFNKCDISSDISDNNFLEMYEIAMKEGEEYSAWKYAHEMFIKMETFGKLAVQYNMITGGSSVPLQNKLYSVAKEASRNGIWDDLSSKERKKQITYLETTLLKSEALKNKQEMVANLYSVVPREIRDNLKNYSYAELESVKEKIKLINLLYNKVSPNIKEKLNEYSNKELKEMYQSLRQGS